MNMFANRFIISMIAVAAFILSSCNKERYDRPQELETICLSVDVPKTKAYIFDSQASLTNPDVGGGDFAVYACLSGENTTAYDRKFMSNVRVNYFKEAAQWRFTDSKGVYVNYYWPLGDETLDFFGHFPLKPSLAGVTEVRYSYEDGPSFDFSLPMNSAGQENLCEFMYSYVTDQSVEIQNEDENNPGIKLDFSHPFAAVSFKLGQSYRMELHDITLSELKYKGTYAHTDGVWSLTYGNNSNGTPIKENFKITINKNIPTDINFDSPIGGPYLVGPQTLDDNSMLSVSYTRLDQQKDTKSVKLKELGSGSWEAGKHYVYTLSMGNNEEEILFQVSVEKWKEIGYKNNIDVE